MKKQRLKEAQIELGNYRSYKKSVADMHAKKRSINIKLKRWVLLITCMDCALSKLTDDVRTYARMRYMDPEEHKHAYISVDMGVSERTLSRWNDQVIRAVAIQLELLETKLDAML